MTYSPNSGAPNGIQEPVLANMNFVDDAGPGIDLHITSGSTAEDAGADLSAIFNFDIDGGARAVFWDIGPDDILATTSVELMSFTAWAMDGAVDLKWETASELNNLGFHLYRAMSARGLYEQITTRAMPGLVSSPVGAQYRYQDTGLANGVTYYYKLEDIETTGMIRASRSRAMGGFEVAGVHPGLRSSQGS